MELFPPEIDWFSYLMIFEDGLVKDPPVPTDVDYRIKKPSAAFFDDCCNEFWFVSTYVAKGLLRDELPYAAWHMEQIAREQLFNMLSWKIGAESGYGFNNGKRNKYIKKYLTGEEWDLLMKTYRMDSIEKCWAALAAAHGLFRSASRRVSEGLGYIYPDYDEKVTEYIGELKTNSC